MTADPVPFLPNERITDAKGLMLVPFATKLNGLQTRIGSVLGGYVTTADFTAGLATKQNHTANLDALSAATQTAFGLSLLGEASATHLLNTTLNAYTTTQTNAAITAALVPYLTSATAAATYQPLNANLTAIALLSTTSYGRGLLTSASATALMNSLSATDLTTGTLPAGRLPALTGAVTTTAGSAATSLATTQSAAVTWSGAQVWSAVTATFGASAGASWTGIVNGAAASTRAFSYRTANVQRWQEGVDNSAEGGSNAGSSYFLGAYSDAGAFLGFAYTIDRATRTVAFPVSPTAPTPTAGDNTTKVPTTAMLVRDYQPLDGDLTSLAGASSTGALYYRSAASTWSPVTIGSGVAFAAGTLSATGSGGTVTSVGLSSTDFTVSGSPVTGSGVITANLATQAGITAASYGSAASSLTLTVNSKGVLTALSAQAIAIGWSAITSGKPTTLAGYGITDAVSSTATQSANLIFAGPPTGVAAAPTFRSLVAADIPSLTATYEAVANKNVSGGYAGYTEGTWTPTVTFATPGTSSVAYTTQTGTYFRVGNLVTLFLMVVFTPTIGTATGNLWIQGFGFTVADITTPTGPVRGLGASYTWPAGRTQVVLNTPTTTALGLSSVGTGIAAIAFATTNLTSGSAHTITGSISFKV